MENLGQTRTKGIVAVTKYGTFEVEEYKIDHESFIVGATLKVKFLPNPDLEVAKQPIGLIQVTRINRSEMTRQDQYEDDASKLARMTNQGTHIDQSTYVDMKGIAVSERDAQTMWKTHAGMPITQTNPVYNANNTLEAIAATLVQQTATNTFGSIYQQNVEPARLSDSPSRLILQNETIEHAFEIVALTLTPPHQFLGSITWGYTAVAGKDTNHPKVDLHKLLKSSDDEPGEEFKQAARLWNGQKVIVYSIQEKIARVQIPNV